MLLKITPGLQAAKKGKKVVYYASRKIVQLAN